MCSDRSKFTNRATVDCAWNFGARLRAQKSKRGGQADSSAPLGTASHGAALFRFPEESTKAMGLAAALDAIGIKAVTKPLRRGTGITNFFELNPLLQFHAINRRPAPRSGRGPLLCRPLLCTGKRPYRSSRRFLYIFRSISAANKQIRLHRRAYSQHENRHINHDDADDEPVHLSTPRQ